MKIEKKYIDVLDQVGEWSLCIMIFTLPFSKSMVEITIVTALVSLVLKKVFTGQKLLGMNTINIFLLLFILASAVSIINSTEALLSIRAFFTKILKFAALFLVTIEIMDTRKKILNFARYALASCIVILADAFIQYFFLHLDLLHGYYAFNFVWQDPSFLGTPTASFPFPNDFAAWMLIFVFPVGIYLVAGRAGLLQNCLNAVTLVCLLYFLVITRVRGAWFGFIGAMSCLVFLKPKTIGIVLLIMGVLCGALVYKELVPHLLSKTSINIREDMWSTGWRIFKKHPVIGSGVNTFFNNYKAERRDADRGKRGSYAHNCYLQMACDSGLIGLFSFLAFAIAVLNRAFRSLKRVKDPFFYSLILGAGLGLVAFLLHSAVDTNLYSLPLAALFWLSAGVLIASVKIAESGA